jgi:hypothetical protein
VVDRLLGGLALLSVFGMVFFHAVPARWIGINRETGQYLIVICALLAVVFVLLLVAHVR